jgi:tetratricopeptide (TPR) repeat protein
MDNSSLRLESVSRGPIHYLRLYGAIDETFDVNAILESGSGRDLIINTKSITRVSSFGVREWVKAMDKLATVKNRIILVDCSPVIVMHLNTVANFGDHCDVVSAQAPYYCHECGWDTEATVPITKRGAGAPESPVTCRRCDRPMELDEEPEAYFRFARPDRYRPLDVHIQEFIDSYLHAERAKTTQTPRAMIETGIRRLSWMLGSRRIIIVSAALLLATLVLIIVLAILASRDLGIPPEALAAYHERLAINDFEGAITLLDGLQADGAVPADLAGSMREEVRTKRLREQERALAEAWRLHGKKLYPQAIDKYLSAERLGASGRSVHFHLAECYRKVDQGEKAYKRYALFVEALDGDTSDKRFDDALYWQADYLVKVGRTEDARQLLERIKSLPRSNFRRSAKRLLNSIP